MLKSRILIFMMALLLISVMLSGCYTIIGYPPSANELTVKKDTGHKGIYREYYYNDSPYYFGDLDDYSYYLYGWSPFYYFNDYWYHPYGGYDDWYYRDYNYDYYNDNDHSYYVPEKKPDVRKRDATEIRRSPSREEQKKESKKDESVQSNGKQSSSDDDQKPQRRYRDDHK